MSRYWVKVCEPALFKTCSYVNMSFSYSKNFQKLVAVVLCDVKGKRLAIDALTCVDKQFLEFRFRAFNLYKK